MKSALLSRGPHAIPVGALLAGALILRHVGALLAGASDRRTPASGAPTKYKNGVDER